jgi:hypothetical protein
MKKVKYTLTTQDERVFTFEIEAKQNESNHQIYSLILHSMDLDNIKSIELIPEVSH